MRISCQIYLVIASLILANTAQAMNVIRPFKIFFHPQIQQENQLQLFARYEHGFDAKGYNCDGANCDPLRIWNCNQNAIAMLKGFCCTCPQTQLLNIVDAMSDDNRGMIAFCGNYSADAVTLAARYRFAHDISFGIYLPIYSMQLKNVSWKDLTLNITEDDARVHEYITDDLADLVCDLGDISLGGWKRSGIGDIYLVAEWIGNFKQYKPVLKSVRLNARLGLGLPTGKKQNQNLINAFTFGNDGAVTAMFAGGINLTLDTYFHLGLDVELRKALGNTRLRRIKTDPAQTDLLLLGQTSAYKDFGIEQQFILYFEVNGLPEICSFKLGYQYYKHGYDALSFLNNCYSVNIANTAQYLQERTIHTMLGMLTFNTGEYVWCNHCINPSFALLFEAPFNGKNSIASPIVGAMLSIDF